MSTGLAGLYDEYSVKSYTHPFADITSPAYDAGVQPGMRLDNGLRQYS